VCCGAGRAIGECDFDALSGLFAFESQQQQQQQQKKKTISKNVCTHFRILQKNTIRARTFAYRIRTRSSCRCSSAARSRPPRCRQRRRRRRRRNESRVCHNHCENDEWLFARCFFSVVVFVPCRIVPLLVLRQCCALVQLMELLKAIAGTFHRSVVVARCCFAYLFGLTFGFMFCVCFVSRSAVQLLISHCCCCCDATE
jgi:hypothetical protein